MFGLKYSFKRVWFSRFGSLFKREFLRATRPHCPHHHHAQADRQQDIPDASEAAENRHINDVSEKREDRVRRHQGVAVNLIPRQGVDITDHLPLGIQTEIFGHRHTKAVERDRQKIHQRSRPEQAKFRVKQIDDNKNKQQ